jgi:hypothetical protein
MDRYTKMLRGFACVLLALIFTGCATRHKESPQLPQQRPAPPPELPVMVSPPTSATIPPVQCLTSESVRTLSEKSIKGWQQGYGECRVDPLERYADGTIPLKSLWYGEYCIAGKAHGAGFALWCSPGDSCSPGEISKHRLRAAGVANMSSLASCPVEFSTTTTTFSGRVNSQGYQELGRVSNFKVVNQSVVLVEQFTGRFAAKNDYLSGALFYNGRTIITSSFGKGNLPRGESLVIEKSGETYLANCDGLACVKVDASLRLNGSDMQLVERAFTRSFLVGAETELLRRLLFGLFPRIAGGPLLLAISAFVEAINPPTL